MEDIFVYEVGKKPIEEGREPVKLKECPFCRKERLDIEQNYRSVHSRNVAVLSMYVRCCCCHAKGPVVSGEVPEPIYDTPKSDCLTNRATLRQKAAEAWNNR